MQVFHWLYSTGNVADIPEDHKKQLRETFLRGDRESSHAPDEKYRGEVTHRQGTKHQKASIQMQATHMTHRNI